MSVFEGTPSEGTVTGTTEPTVATVPSDLEKRIAELSHKSAEELAKGKAYADQHIKNLEEQINGLREDLDKKLNAEQVLEEMKKRQAEDQMGNTSPSLGEADVKDLIKNTLVETEAERIAAGNLALVDAKVTEVYGDKGPEVIERKAKELGMSKDELAALAQKSPSAFFAATGLNQTKPVDGVATSKGTVNTANMSFNNSGPQEGTWEYYQELRASNKRKYWSPEVQKQLIKDRETKGEAFYGRK